MSVNIQVGDVVEVIGGCEGHAITDEDVRSGLVLGSRFSVQMISDGYYVYLGTDPEDGWHHSRFRVVARNGQPMLPVPTIHDVIARCPKQADAIKAAFPDLFPPPPKPLTWPELEDQP